MPKMSKKNQRGSIALFVLLSLLFFLIVVTSVSVSSKNKEKTIDKQLAQIKQIYEKNVGKEAEMYQKKTEEVAQVTTPSLTVNPNGGRWGNPLNAGSSTIYKTEDQYVSIDNPECPKVIYNGNGGIPERESDTVVFNNWILTGAGSLYDGNRYKYGNGAGTLTASYEDIKLTNATRTNYTLERMV